MFSINGIQWRVKIVPSGDPMLYRDDGSVTIGMCDNNTRIIYLDESLHGKMLKKVIAHELTHAAMFSYGIKLNIDQEEILAEIIATYGEEIIHITDELFAKIKRERY